MKATIDETFKDVDSDDLRAQIMNTHYNIFNEVDNMIILPKFWEGLVKPGCRVRMEMFPMKIPAIHPLPPLISTIGPPPPIIPPPPPAFEIACPPPAPYIERSWRKKKNKHKGIPPPPPPMGGTPVLGVIPPATLELSNIEVLDHEIWKADDQDIVNRWLKNLSDEVKGSPLLRAPGMFRAPAGFRDAFKMKSEVLCALLGITPYYTATFIVRMLCKAEKNHDLLQEQWPDVMMVVLQTLCEHNLHRRKHGSDHKDSAQKLKIENVLAKVYRRGLLSLPEKDDRDDYVLMRGDRNIVISAVSAMNIWSKRKFYSKLVLNPDIEIWNRDSSTSSDVCVGYNFLRLDGLDIGSLLAMGKINIAWTDCLEKHLHLDNDMSDNDSVYSDITDDSTATLYIYWFDFTEYAWMGS